MSKSKSNEEKVKFIIEFITEYRQEFTRCADAHKAFMAKHGKVSYVHFNRKFRELCPDLKPKKKVRVLRPQQTIVEPQPKNQELKAQKREIAYYHKALRDSEALLQEAIATGTDQERIDYYRDIRDRDRKAIVNCYEVLLTFYEDKISNDIKEINAQLHNEEISNGEELERMLATNANALINESDESEESEEADIEESVSSTLSEAADIMSKKSRVKKNQVNLESIPEFTDDDEMRG